MYLAADKRSVDQLEGEDLVLFINACFTCTQQNEFYQSASSQTLSIDFLHQYILGNYRRLYALTLASGINHFNRGLIIHHLLAAGSPADAAQRQEEAQLINAALNQLPVNRVLKLFVRLKARRINNRRTRAVIKNYVEKRKDPAFDAVKYRSKIKTIVSHAHLKIADETGRFLFDKMAKSFKTPIFDSYYRAQFSQQALYELPYTVAENFAEKHGIPRARFLKNIESQLTRQEKLRLQASAAREKKTHIDIDFNTVSVTKLVLYWLSLPKKSRAPLQARFESALDKHAVEMMKGTHVNRDKIALVADRSYSMWGGHEKKKRPLAIVYGIHQVLRRVARQYDVFWSTPVSDALHLTPQGQSNIVEPFIEALKVQPDVILIVSDGYENDPPALTGRVHQAWLKMVGPSVKTHILHLNPVYDAQNYDVKKLSDTITSVGIRDVEDLPMTLEFSRFAGRQATLETLEQYLRGKFHAD